MTEKKEKNKEMVEIKACRETLKVARPLIFSKKRENIIGCIIIYI